MKLFNLSTDTIGRPPKPMLRGRVWYIRQRIAGKDCWRSLHTSDKREAQYLALEIWRERQNDRIKQIIPAPPVKISTIWERYTETDKYKDLAESTKRSKTRAWSVFAEWCILKKINYPDQLTVEIATKYLQGDNRKNKTFNNLLNDLRIVFQASPGVKNVFDEIYPLPIHRGSEDKRSEQFRAFSDDEMDLIEKSISESRMKNKDEWRIAARIARHTGLRYKDVALLKWQQIKRDELGLYIELSPHKTDTKTGGKVVFIRLIHDFARELTIWRASADNEYVLINLKEAYEKCFDQATKPFNKMCAKLNIDASFHSYRVTLVTKAAKAGVDLKEFGGVVGHTTEGQTRAYNRAALDIDMEAVLSIKLA